MKIIFRERMLKINFFIFKQQKSILIIKTVTKTIFAFTNQKIFQINNYIFFLNFVDNVN